MTTGRWLRLDELTNAIDNLQILRSVAGGDAEITKAGAAEATATPTAPATTEAAARASSGSDTTPGA